jgi:uncharacterized protein
MFMLAPANDHPLAERFRDFVRDQAFPCVGAKSALSRGTMTILIGRDIRSGWDDLAIYPALQKLAAGWKADPQLFQTLVVIFADSPAMSEQDYEASLWQRIQSLSDKDVWLGARPDPRVSDNPRDPHFSLSFAGEAFFVVGLHPNASRPARRFEAPAMVFNLHDQFEMLRAQGRYEKLRASIIERDVALAGSVNPMLARHGDQSEARQYSGRAVEDDWRPPFAGRRDFAGGSESHVA